MKLMSRGISRFVRRSLRLLPVLAALVLCSCTGADRLRIVTLNVEWFPGQRISPKPEDITSHTAAVRDCLASLKPELLIATEVCDAELFRSVAREATGLDLHVISNFSRPDDRPGFRNQQVGIASRLKARAGWAEEWDKTNIPDLRRGFTFAAIENPRSGRLIMVYGVHLKSNRSETPEEAERNYRMRDESIDQLVRHVEAMEQQFGADQIDGWIVAGDFNTNHDGRFGDHVIEKMEAAGFYNTFIDVPAGKRHTWKGRGQFKSTTFDYIMVRGFGEPRARVIEVGESVSDHNAVVLDVRLPSAER